MRLCVDLVCGERNSDGCAGIDSTLENWLLRTDKEDVPCWRDILLAVAANLGKVRVGGDDAWVLFDWVCNIFFGSMDAFAVACGALLIFFGAIFNLIFGWMGALAFGRGVVIFFLGTGTETLGTVARAPWAFAFGGSLVAFFFFSFFVADIVVVVYFNLKSGGNCIIPSSCNNFKLGSVNFGLPLPCAIIFLDADFAW
jgi:hypothetical protein